MPKKRLYSVPLRDMWKEYHEWCQKNKQTDAHVFYNQKLKEVLSCPFPLVQHTRRIELIFWLMDYQKEFLHIYLEAPELYEVIKAIQLKDLQAIKQYLQDTGVKKQFLVPSTGQILDTVFYNIAVHVPNHIDSFTYSFFYLPDGGVILHFEKDGKIGAISEQAYEDSTIRTDEAAKTEVQNFNFAVNLLTYMRCFPECVKDGVPEDNKDKLYIPQGQSIQLGASDKMQEIIRDTTGQKRPHYRTGYFKTLTSDFYTHKKGQVIFVRETMVNAKAKTVVLSDDEEKLDKYTK